MKTQVLGIFLFLFLFHFSHCHSKLCNPNDQKVLLQIKKSLNNPSILSSWKPRADCCTRWEGVVCSSPTNATGPRVTYLKIYNSVEFAPGIPSEVGDLPFLQSLDMSVLNLTGTIPRSITKLKNLTSLSFQFSGLTGIPEYITELKNLESLNLDGNGFTGPVPSFLSSFPKLNFLSLRYNKFTGVVPESFGSFQSKSIQLYLTANRLSGVVPQSLSKLDFQIVSLQGNKLRGDISMFLGPNKKIEVLDLGDNRLSFDLSNVKFPKSLTVVQLQRNLIYGSIPKELTLNTNLIVFSVFGNRLCGKIPEGGKLQSLDPKSFAGNRCLCGAPLKRKCK